MDSENAVYNIITKNDDDQISEELVPKIDYAVTAVSIFLIIVVMAVCWCIFRCITRRCKRENVYELPPAELIGFGDVSDVPPPPPPPLPARKSSAIANVRTLPNDLLEEIRGAYSKRGSYDIA